MEVAVLGALNIETVGTASAASCAVTVLPGEITTALGGTGWNAAQACACLGLDTAFISVLASDGYADVIRARAQSLGLDLESCRWEPGQNDRSLTVCDADGKPLAAVTDSRFSHRIDARFCLGAARSMSRYAVAVADCSLQAPALHRLSEKLEGTPLIVSAVSVSKCLRVQDILPRIHTLLLGAEEAERLTGYAGAERGATALLKMGLQRVCLVSDGLFLADREEMRRLTDTEAPNADAALTAALAASTARSMDFDATARLLTAACAVAARSSEPVNPELARLKPFI